MTPNLTPSDIDSSLFVNIVFIRYIIWSCVALTYLDISLGYMIKELWLSSFSFVAFVAYTTFTTACWHVCYDLTVENLSNFPLGADGFGGKREPSSGAPVQNKIGLCVSIL